MCSYNEDSWVWLVGPGETIAESGVSGTVFEILPGVCAAIVPLRCSARTWANCATIGDMVSLWPRSLVDGVGADEMVPYRLAISFRGAPKPTREEPWVPWDWAMVGAKITSKREKQRRRRGKSGVVPFSKFFTRKESEKKTRK